MTLFLLVLFAALAFEYINGFHDTANAIATVVSTKVLTPRQAIVWAAFWNLVGALAGTAVASTIGKGLVEFFAKQGVQVAVLNVLRAQIREAELYAAQIYITRDFRVKRPDIMQALNRLSSAVYVLMVWMYLAAQGKYVDLEQVTL